METKKINLGRVGLVPKGAYSPDATYGRMHVVTYKNTTYWSKQEGNTGHEPLGEDEWWGILVDGQAAYAGALNANEATVRANTAAEKAEHTNAAVETAEQERRSAETERDKAEEQRKAQAQSNAEAEQARADAEQSRVEAETQRVEAEERRASEETLRAAAEDTRKSDEADRIAGETSREQQEDSRVAAEQTRDAQETQRNIDETKRAGAETKRADAEDARKEAETGRVSAEKSRVAAESQRVEAEERRASELKDVKKQVENKADLVDGKVPLAQLGNIDTQVMLVVDKLPNTDIKANKIYLVKNTDSTEDQNVYTEYVYVNGKWEKLGEFKPEVSLSEYIKSNDIYQCIKKEYDSSKRGENAIAIDDSAIASGKFATAIGNNAQAKGNYSIAIGNDSQATGEISTALGSGAQAKGNYSITIGGEATGDDSTALGDEAQATGNYSIAIGSYTQAKGNYSIAIGSYANTSTISKYALAGIDENKEEMFNIEEITYSQYGNKKYLIGLGGYDGTNIIINNEAGEEILNPNIKSVQEIINSKADTSAIPTKVSQLTNDSNFVTTNSNTTFSGLTISNNAQIKYIQKTGGSEGTYLIAETPADRVANKVYAADGSLFDVGKVVKKVQCNVSGDANNIEFGYTTVDGTYNFAVVPTVTTNHGGIMSSADKVKLDKLQELVELKIVGTSESSVAMKPNKVYEITVGSALTITLEEPTDKTVYNEYQGTFDTGNTIPTVTFPSNVRWNDIPKVGANQHVEFSIRYSGGKYYGICQVWDMTTEESV